MDMAKSPVSLYALLAPLAARLFSTLGKDRKQINAEESHESAGGCEICQ